MHTVLPVTLPDTERTDDVLRSLEALKDSRLNNPELVSGDGSMYSPSEAEHQLRQEIWEQYAPEHWLGGNCPHMFAYDDTVWPYGLGVSHLAWILTHVDFFETAAQLALEAEMRYRDWLRGAHHRMEIPAAPKVFRLRWSLRRSGQLGTTLEKLPFGWSSYRGGTVAVAGSWPTTTKGMVEKLDSEIETILKARTRNGKIPTHVPKNYYEPLQTLQNMLRIGVYELDTINPYDRRPKPSRFHLLFPKDATTYIFDSMTAQRRRPYPTAKR